MLAFGSLHAKDSYFRSAPIKITGWGHLFGLRALLLELLTVFGERGTIFSIERDLTESLCRRSEFGGSFRVSRCQRWLSSGRVNRADRQTV